MRWSTPSWRPSCAGGSELLRQLYQDHLDLRSERETCLEEVLDAEGMPRGSVESGHRRALQTVFGGSR